MAPRRPFVVVATTALALAVSVLGSAPVSAHPAPSPRDGHHPFGGTATVDVPAGGTGTITSGPVDTKMKKAEVLVRDVGPGDGFKRLVFALAPLTPGKRLLTCFYVAQERLTQHDDDGFGSFTFSEEGQVDALVTFVACMRMALLIADYLAEQGAGTSRTMPATCPTNPSAVPARLRKVRGGYRIDVNGGMRTAGRTAALRVTCRRTADKIVFDIRPRSRKRTLRSIIGSNLTVGVQSPSSAENSTTLKVTFRKKS